MQQVGAASSSLVFGFFARLGLFAGSAQRILFFPRATGEPRGEGQGWGRVQCGVLGRLAAAKAGEKDARAKPLAVPGGRHVLGLVDGWWLVVGGWRLVGEAQLWIGLPVCLRLHPPCWLSGLLAARLRLVARLPACPRTSSQQPSSQPASQPATMPLPLLLLLPLLRLLLILPPPLLPPRRVARLFPSPLSSCFTRSLAAISPSLATRVAPFPTPCRAARPLNPVNNRPLPPQPPPPRNQPPPHPVHPVPHMS